MQTGHPTRWVKDALPSRPSAAAAVGLVMALAAGQAAGQSPPTPPPTELEESFEGPGVAWSVSESDAPRQVLDHRRGNDSPHRGGRCESIVIEAAAGSVLRMALPVGPLAAIDELTASIWVRSNRPDIGLAMRVALPRCIDRSTGAPVSVLVFGTRSREVGRWTRLDVGGIPDGIARQVAALRAEYGAAVDPTGAVVTELVLDLYSSPGRYELSIDDLSLAGAVFLSADAARPAGGLPSAAFPGERGPSPRPADTGVERAGPGSEVAATPEPPARLSHGVFEVGELPFFPRAVDHNGEPLTALAGLGFNCIRTRRTVTGELLAEARRAGMWVISPPPELPEVDPGEPESLPAFSPNWDRVLIWDMGSGLCGDDLGGLAERGRRVRACDFRPGRPLAASADSAIRELSRHLDLIVARRTVLGTSLELDDYAEWLRQRPRLARPGTPMLTVLATEHDPEATEQVRRLVGAAASPLIDPESLVLTSLAAVAAGARGIIFTSSSRLDGTDPAATLRALACREANLQLSAIEPWAASGRFASVAESSDPEVKAVVIEAARTRIVVASRLVQASQLVARRYAGSLPPEGEPLTLVVPGVPEPHRAWEVTPLGLKPLKQKRVTGGSLLTLEDFHSRGFVLFSGDPAVTGDMQRRVQEASGVAVRSLTALASRGVADATAILSRLPPKALGVLPAASMLADARVALSEGLTSSTDPATSIRRLRRAEALAGQVCRLAWERGAMATGSFVADALATSVATLPEHWHFHEATLSATPGPELLAGGSMDRLEDLDGTGWRHFSLTDESIRTAVEVSRIGAASGAGFTRLIAQATAEPPVVVETPPVWITTPEVPVPAGKLVRIEADVHVPAAVAGSVDGLLVFDSFGGPSLAERVGPTGGWRRLVLHRIAPDDSPATPLVVTFALTGLGEARLDAVSVRVLERGVAGQPIAAHGSTYPIHVGPAGGGPGPAGQPAAPPRDAPVGSAAVPPAVSTTESGVDRDDPDTASGVWPDMQVKWPRLLPFGGSTAPPPGPGGGRVDPFKRGRGN
jgi:hypothetical protein